MILIDEFKEGGNLRKFVTQVGLLDKLDAGDESNELLNKLCQSLTHTCVGLDLYGTAGASVENIPGLDRTDEIVLEEIKMVISISGTKTGKVDEDITLSVSANKTGTINGSIENYVEGQLSGTVAGEPIEITSEGKFVSPVVKDASYALVLKSNTARDFKITLTDAADESVKKSVTIKVKEA